jgi:hypothetical protein
VLTDGDVLGECEILAPLGRGGMGEVYLARDRRLGRQVAVKVLPAAFAGDAARLVRFEREARSASALNHPNICTIHALGQLPDGRRFIVMEHVDGATLRTVHRERLDLPRAVEIGRQLTEGLAAAHDAGVVHRDIKPENVMVRADGLVKILDFGLAKVLPESAMALGESTRSVDASLAGGIVGTVQYMSPEQARGQPTDARTDIWAVGAVLYELVAGHPPFDGRTTSDVVANVLHVEPPPLGRFAHDCPPELQRIVSKCLRKDRGHRYQTMRDVALDLEVLGDTLRGGSRQTAPRESAADVEPPSQDATAAPSRSRWWLGAAGVLLALAAGGIVWLNGRVTSPEATRSAGRKELALKRLTFDAGLQTDVSFSPDGRFIAYASDRSGNFDIWVQPVDGGDPVQITKEPAQDVQPAWSPDGDSIAFRSERGGGGIFVMPALGGHAQQLSTFGSHPSWLGQSEIFFLLGNPAGGVATIQLFVVRVDGDAPREVLRDFVLEGGLFWAAGHPDGRISVLADNRKRGLGLFTLSRDGQSVTASHIPASFPIHRWTVDSPSRFHWNRSGTALYVEGSVDGIQNLWRVAVDPRSLAWLNMERLTTGPGRDIAASLSGDGRRLAYTTAREQTRVHVQALSPDGTTLTGPSDAVTEADAEVFGSALANDGRRLAYLVRRAGSARYELRIANLDTGANELLDDDLSAQVALGWSPDDSAILHQRIRQVRGRTDQSEAQLVLHAPGSRETVLLPWSSRAFLGTEVASGPHELLGSVFNFSGAPSQIAIWSMVGDASLTKHRVLFSDPKANLWEAAYVPGGRWISFVREPLGEAQRIDMMIGPAGGSSPAAWSRLLTDHPWADKPRWSTDGRLLYFLSRGSRDYFNLWAVRFDPVRGVPTGTPFPITRYDSPALFVSPHVGKVGMDVRRGRVALTMSSTTGSIWMLDDVEPGEQRTGSR